jgi:23S rRNA pseudouridine1911/1915/1917 synthase
VPLVSDTEYFRVPESLHGERLDVGVSRLTGLSRTKVAGLVSDGLITLNGKKPSRSDRLSLGARLAVTTAPEAAAIAASTEPVPGLGILYEDDQFVVVDKPVGVAAHTSPGWSGPTVTAGLRAAGVSIATSGAAEREGIVHRLDVGTSGLMVVAKSEAAYTSLKRQFKERTVAKTYHALVQGHPDPSRGTVDAPIGRHPSHDYKFAVINDGKPSVTHYDTLEAFPYASLLEIGLETGRTHQIRVHMAALRHPCCGDITYGADPTLAQRLGLKRQWLQAVRLSFEHPATGERVSFQSPYPADLAYALSVIRV